MIIDKRMIGQYHLQSGDIGAVKGDGPAAWACRNLIEPPTDRFHHFLLWMLAADNDRVLLESTGEGNMAQTLVNIVLHAIFRTGEVGHAVAVGRLSMYDGQDVRFFRPRFVEKDKRRHAPAALTCYGRNSYGYSYITKLVLRALWKWASIMWHERRFRRLKASEVPYVMGEKALICTAAANVGYWLVGEMILPIGVEATPNAFEQARMDGVLDEIDPLTGDTVPVPEALYARAVRNR